MSVSVTLPLSATQSPVTQTAATPSPATQGDAAPTARSFLQTLEGALMRLTTLRIATVVGDVVVAGSGLDTTVSVRASAAAEAASTQINLLDGQITNVFSPGFAGLSGGTLQAFHQAQVEKGSAMVAANLLELQKLASALLFVRR